MKVTLNNKDELIKKSQLISNLKFNILGEEPQNNEHSTEIYYDKEFYQKLLRDLIEDVGSSIGKDVSFKTAIKKQSKMKNNLNLPRPSSLTKGKVIRYNVHKKLIGFVVPQKFNIPESTDILFSNLFGTN